MATLVTRSNGGAAVRHAYGEWLGWDPSRSSVGNHGGVAGLEIARTESGYTVEIPVPGYKPAEIGVTFENGVLSVAGKSEKRSFTRTLLVPDEIDSDNIAAKVENGMLTLTLSVHPKAQPKKIEVTFEG
jgi:HSP20 family molecular chaperone IbpA